MSNVVSFKKKNPRKKKSSTNEEVKAENLLALKLELMANLSDLLHTADEETKDLTKGFTFRAQAPNTSNNYIITITRV